MPRGRKVTLRVVRGGDGTTGGDGTPPGGSKRPAVHVIQGRRAEALDEAEQWLIVADLNLYQRGDLVVRVARQLFDMGPAGKVDGIRILPLTNEYMRLAFSEACALQKYDRRAADWIDIDCPKDFAAAYLERIGHWRLRHLWSTTAIPLLRQDGTIITTPGYDAESGIYYDRCGVIFPTVPPNPSRADALAALDQIDTLFGTLDLVDDVSHSAALSAVMTPVLRSAMAAAPMHGVTAPVAGSGKSKLTNLGPILATGYSPVIISLGSRDEETEKRVGAELIEGTPAIVIDNAGRPISGDFLCQAITERVVSPRVLGESRNVKVVNTATWYATGNNLKFAGDMVRRALLIRLDPGCERPELREFEAPDPVVVARERRPELVIAILTIVRAFHLAGCPREIAPLGSFEDWSRWVRDPLIWLGRPDPVLAMGDARNDDPVLSALLAVTEQWAGVFGGRRVTCREVADEANKQGTSGYSHSEFRDALLRVCGEGGNIYTRRLGKWLGQVKGRIAEGKRLIEAGKLDGIMCWKLVFGTQSPDI